MCSAEGKGDHYSIDKAGVWVDCVREGRPVIHNNYEKLAHKKGLPEGHSPIVRELVVPIYRKEKVVAILGVGNKKTDYDESDVETVTELTSLVFDIIARKQAEEELSASENKFSKAFNSSPDAIVLSRLSNGLIIDVNETFVKMFGFTKQEAIGHTTIDLGIWPDPEVLQQLTR